MISNRSSLMTRHICACGRPVPFNADGKATYHVGGESTCRRCCELSSRRKLEESKPVMIAERDYIAHARQVVGWTVWGGVAL